MNIRRPQPRFPRRARERGVVLFVALIFLILLTLLAIGASSGSLLQQRMVAATRNAQLATMSADSALRGAEWKLWSHANDIGAAPLCPPDGGGFDPATGCVTYAPQSALYAPDGAVTQFRAGNNTWLSLAGPITYQGPSGSGYTSGLDTANLAENPQYIIEDMGRVKPPSAGPACESGVTGCNSGNPGSSLHLEIFRITARATGGNKNTVRVVQSTFDAQTN